MWIVKMGKINEFKVPVSAEGPRHLFIQFLTARKKPGSSPQIDTIVNFDPLRAVDGDGGKGRVSMMDEFADDLFVKGIPSTCFDVTLQCREQGSLERGLANGVDIDRFEPILFLNDALILRRDDAVDHAFSVHRSHCSSAMDLGIVD